MQKNGTDLQGSCVKCFDNCLLYLLEEEDSRAISVGRVCEVKEDDCKCNAVQLTVKYISTKGAKIKDYSLLDKRFHP